MCDPFLHGSSSSGQTVGYCNTGRKCNTNLLCITGNAATRKMCKVLRHINNVGNALPSWQGEPAARSPLHPLRQNVSPFHHLQGLESCLLHLHRTMHKRVAVRTPLEGASMLPQDPHGQQENSSSLLDYPSAKRAFYSPSGHPCTFSLRSTVRRLDAVRAFCHYTFGLWDE